MDGGERNCRGNVGSWLSQDGCETLSVRRFQEPQLEAAASLSGGRPNRQKRQFTDTAMQCSTSCVLRPHLYVLSLATSADVRQTIDNGTAASVRRYGSRDRRRTSLVPVAILLVAPADCQSETGASDLKIKQGQKTKVDECNLIEYFTSTSWRWFELRRY